RDEILLIALDELASTVVAMMVLFAIVNVTIFLVFGGLASRTHVSNDHGELLTSTGWVCACGSTVPQISVGEHYMDITTLWRPLRRTMWRCLRRALGRTLRHSLRRLDDEVAGG